MEEQFPGNGLEMWAGMLNDTVPATALTLIRVRFWSVTTSVSGGRGRQDLASV